MYVQWMNCRNFFNYINLILYFLIGAESKHNTKKYFHNINSKRQIIQKQNSMWSYQKMFSWKSPNLIKTHPTSDVYTVHAAPNTVGFTENQWQWGISLSFSGVTFCCFGCNQSNFFWLPLTCDELYKIMNHTKT